MIIKQKLKSLFDGLDTCDFYCDNNHLRIKIGKMYESPNLSFAKLLEISKIFGTTNIDVDSYNMSGCESCDYGSDYGHNIDIRDATKNVKQFKKECK